MLSKTDQHFAQVDFSVSLAQGYFVSLKENGSNNKDNSEADKGNKWL